MDKVRYLDLFAGIGGLSLGLKRAAKRHGLETELVEAREIDVRASKTYEDNFGTSPLGDVRELAEIEPYDVLLAGFPCQPFSYAGGKKGFGDTRGTLFFDIMRIVDINPPKLMIFENVRGILTNDEGRTIKTIQHEIEKRGYSFDSFTLNSVNFGVPQNRVRVYMICILGGGKHVLTIKSDKGPPDSNNIQSLKGDFVNVLSILEDDPDEKYDCTPTFIEGINRALGGDLSTLHGRRLIDYRGGHSLHSWELGSRGICSLREIEFMNEFIKQRRNKKFGKHRDGKMLTRDQISTFWDSDDLDSILSNLTNMNYLKIVHSDTIGKSNDSIGSKISRYKPVAGNFSFEVYKFLHPEKISVTVVASDCSRMGIYHNQRIRRLTPREIARLQGFPDNFILHSNDSDAYFQLGNAVTVTVAEEVCFDGLSGIMDSFSLR